jgi:ankyrin repeat protein
MRNIHKKILNDQLFFAATDGNSPSVEQLIKAGADINAKNIEENTALHLAVTNTHPDIVEKLLEKNAQVLEQNTKQFYNSISEIHENIIHK